MTVTMTMEEYLSLQQKAKDYRVLVEAAKVIIRNEKKMVIPNSLKSDCYNYTRWASENDIDAIPQQFGTIEEDA
jgi:hypothetical protein